MEKIIKSKSFNLEVLFCLLMISLPSKFLSLLFLALYIAIKLLKIKNFNRQVIIIVGIMFVNMIFVVAYLGVNHLKNSVLFFIFISPLIMLVTKNKSHDNVNWKIKQSQKKRFKKTIEIFIVVQILFSIVAILYRGLSTGFNLDVNFGDIVAGTFRIPLTYSSDASNVIFAFTMIIVLMIYRMSFKKEVNKYILYTSYVIVFLSAVNHLFLALIIALSITTLKPKKIFITVGSVGVLLFALSIVSPVNFSLITGRVSLLFAFTTGSGVGGFEMENLKISFFLNFIHDFSNETFRFLFLGAGAGNYSSRSALFFTGEYVESFKFISVSPLMRDNTYFLYKELISRPPWGQGSFNFPYGSIFTFIAEFGLIFATVLFRLLYKAIRRIRGISKINTLIIFTFICIASLVDNYLEYYQSTFILYILLSEIDKLNSPIIQKVS